MEARQVPVVAQELARGTSRARCSAPVDGMNSATLRRLFFFLGGSCAFLKCHFKCDIFQLLENIENNQNHVFGNLDNF